MSEAPTGNIYERLARARVEFQANANFKKTTKEETKKKGEKGLQFDYLPIEQAKPLIETCSATQGVTIIPADYEPVPDGCYKFYKEKEDYYSGKVEKKEWTHKTAFITFKLVSGPNEETDQIALRILAEADDNSDKGINKLYTMAYKNMAKIVFGYSESAKDDSKYEDAREQDADFTPTEEVPTKEQKAQRAEALAKDPFFSKPAKTEPKKETAGAEPDRTKMLDEIAQITKKSTKANATARTFLDGKKAYFELETETLVQILSIIRGL